MVRNAVFDPDNSMVKLDKVLEFQFKVLDFSPCKLSCRSTPMEATVINDDDFSSLFSKASVFTCSH